MKGKGRMQTYWIVSRSGYKKPFPDFDRLAADDNPKPKKLPITVGKDPNPSGGRPSTESGFSETVSMPADSNTSLCGSMPENPEHKNNLQVTDSAKDSTNLENNGASLGNDSTKPTPSTNGQMKPNILPEIQVLPPHENCEEISW